jgi:hypothetical protein
VKEKTCNLPGALKGYIHDCYPIFSDAEEEKEDWNVNGTM